MTTISSAGIGSGLDVETIVTKLMTIERQPITNLQTQATTINSKISVWGSIKSALSTLNDASDTLAKASTWTARSVSSSSAAVTATVTGSGALGAVTVRPTQLATTQSNASGGFAAKTDLIGAGTLSIEQGTWTNETAFAVKSGTSAVTVTLTASDTLETARDKINAANAGVTASIVNDGTSYRLVTTSASSGAANGFRISATDSDGNNTDAAGLSRLAYNPPAGATSNTRKVAAQDAIALVNNLEMHSATNTFADALEGVSFTLNQATGTDASLTLTTDTATLKKNIDTFVSAYNALQSLIKTNTKYNPDDPTKGGKLQGDRTAIGLQYTLRNLLGSSGPSTAAFTKLSDIGMTVATDGTLSVSSDKLTTALAKPAEVGKLFAGDSADTSKPGIGKLFGNAIDAMLLSDGSVQSRTDNLQSSLKRNESQQDRLEGRMTLVEKRMRAQYTALDTSMASLSSLSSYVTQQITAWNNAKS